METAQKEELLKRCGTVEAALAYLGDQDEEVIRYKKLLTVFDDPADHVVNYQTAVVLIRALNEKREPNWDDPNEWKYSNWFWMKGGSSGFRYYGCDSWFSSSIVGSRLCFFDPEAGEWLANQHLDVFKHFMLIIKK